VKEGGKGKGLNLAEVRGQRKVGGTCVSSAVGDDQGCNQIVDPIEQ